MSFKTKIGKELARPVRLMRGIFPKRRSSLRLASINHN